MKLKRMLALLSSMLLLFAFGCAPSGQGDVSSQEEPQYFSTADGMVYRTEKNTQMYFNGRWYDKDVSGVPCKATTNEGSEIYFLTQGANSVTLSCPDNGNVENTKPVFAYIIDGLVNYPERIEVNDDFEITIPLPSDGTHIVRLVCESLNAGVKKWDLANGFAVAGITSDAGSVTGIKPMNKTIAFYGDSITEGVFTFSLNWNYGGSGTYTYAWQAAMNLSAVPYVCGYGSSGVTQDGFFKDALTAVDWMSNGIADPGAEEPAVIVINHGANDQKAENETFKAGYRRLIERLHEKHQSAVIIALDPFGQFKAKQIEEVANEYDYVHYVSTEGWGLTFTDGLHPNKNGAQKAGEKLAEAITAIVGEDFFKFK